jgi:acyl transferase domain-containing protein
MRIKMADNLTSLQKASLIIKQLNKTINDYQSTIYEPIAVVGMACRFPGAPDINAFWNLLFNGESGITEVPADRWDCNRFYDPDNKPGTMYTKQGGFIEDVYAFDPQRFGLTEMEAKSMDPQQRIVLETAWEALYNGGYINETRSIVDTGIYIGIATSDYNQLVKQLTTLMSISPYYITGNSFNSIAGRLAYIFGFRGPGMVIDTACSSSLVAVHQACQALRNNECYHALAGGINIILTPDNTIAACSGGMISGDGKCKSFDAEADGYVRSEGCGIVLLKKVSSAIKDRDHIFALIRGSAVNQNGHRASYTAPHGLAQEQLIRTALASARLDPGEVAYIEAHGSATKLGDPVELGALGTVFGVGRPDDKKLVVGSVKTNLGHMEAAAGMGGIIKVILSLKNNVIPAHLNFKNPSPHIDWDNNKLAVPAERTAWPAGYKKKYAGVSSFGITGINAHVVLEEAPSHTCLEVREEERNPKITHLLTLSGHTLSDLESYQHNFASYLAQSPSQTFDSLIYTANTCGLHGKYRRALIAESKNPAGEILAGKTGGLINKSQAFKDNPKVVFLFTGQGSIYPQAGKELYTFSRIFKEEMDRCDAILNPLLDKSLKEILFDEENSPALLNQARYAQPALFALEYALARFWLALGVRPALLIGHSLGEYVAACLGGIFELADALRLIVHRANLIHTLADTGIMVTVFAGEDRVKEIIRPYYPELSIAIINGPAQTVISGTRSAVDAAIKKFSAQKITAMVMPLSHPFHSSMLNPILDSFYEVAQQISYKAPVVDIISNLTGKMANAEMATADYWGRHLTGTVRFYDNLLYLDKLQPDILLEIGPSPVLIALSRELIKSEGRIWLPSLQADDPSLKLLFKSVAKLYVEGLNIDWDNFYKGMAYEKLPLPPYSFTKKYCFFIPESRLGKIHEFSHHSTLSTGATHNGVTENTATDRLIADTVTEKWLYEVTWQAVDTNYNQAKAADVRKNVTWIIFYDTKGVGKKLASRLEHEGISHFTIQAGDLYTVQPRDRQIFIRPGQLSDYNEAFKEILTRSSGAYHIVHLWSLNDAIDYNPDYTIFEHAQSSGCYSVLNCIQALNNGLTGLTVQRVSIITGATQAVGQSSKNTIQLLHAPLWSFGKVIQMEHPELNCRLLDLPYPAHQATDKDIEALYQELSSADAAEDENQLAFRKGQLYVPRLKRKIEALSCRNTLIGEGTKVDDGTRIGDGTYLITGGLGALGMQVTDWLISKGAKHLALLGRSGVTNESTKKKLEAYRSTGIQIRVYAGDVAVFDELTAVFDAIKQELPPLRGIFHAAGVLDDGIILRQNVARFQNVFRAKIAGSIHLHNVSINIPLDYFVLFSSVASLFGSLGQANYAAANGYLDALAAHRQALGLPVHCINWGPWEQLGMAQTSATLGDYFRQSGFIPFTAKTGLHLLEAILSMPDYRAIAMDIDWHRFSLRLDDQKFRFISACCHPELDTNRQDHARKLDTLKKISGSSGAERVERLAAYLQSGFEEMLGIKLAGEQCSQPIKNIGLDSLIAIQIRNRINKDLDLDISIIALLEDATIFSLAVELNEQLNSKTGSKTGRETGRENPENIVSENNRTVLTVDDAQTLLQQLDSLSEEDMDKLLSGL